MIESTAPRAGDGVLEEAPVVRIRGMANRLATDLVEGEAKRLVAKATVKDALKSGTMDSVRGDGSLERVFLELEDHKD